MQVRIAEISIGIIIGIVTWWCWEPCVASLRVGLCAYGGLLLLVRRNWQGRVIIWMLALLFRGVENVEYAQFNRDVFQSDGYTTGWVVKSNRRQALIQNEEERWNMDFYQEAPKQGALVSVWHQPKRGLIDWGGGVDPEQRIQRERTGRRQAKEWIVHTEPKRAVKPDIFGRTEIWWCFMGAIIWR